MAPDLLERTLRPALWGAIGVSAGALAVGPPSVGGGFLAGATWNIANLGLLRALARSLASGERRRAGGLLAAKLAVLYPVGALLACSGCYSLTGMLVGFSGVFVVLLGLAGLPGPALHARGGVMEPQHG